MENTAPIFQQARQNLDLIDKVLAPLIPGALELTKLIPINKIHRNLATDDSTEFVEVESRNVEVGQLIYIDKAAPDTEQNITKTVDINSPAIILEIKEMKIRSGHKSVIQVLDFICYEFKGQNIVKFHICNGRRKIKHVSAQVQKFDFLMMDEGIVTLTDLEQGNQTEFNIDFESKIGLKMMELSSQDKEFQVFVMKSMDFENVILTQELI